MDGKTEATTWKRIKTVSETGDLAFCLEPSSKKKTVACIAQNLQQFETVLSLKSKAILNSWQLNFL